jgi:hypothetical protein
VPEGLGQKEESRQLAVSSQQSVEKENKHDNAKK